MPDRGAALHDDDVEEYASVDWSRQWATVQRHWVTLASLALIGGSLIWKAAFLSHYFYWEDDFQVLDVSLKSHLSWGFLTQIDGGHFFPGVYLMTWVLARVALYNWLAGSLIVLVMLAAAGLAAWRLLRTLLGNRSAILIPLTLYLLSPLAFPTDAWWIDAVESIPLQIALFMALNSHLHYVWTGKFRYAVASAAWQLFGLVFFEKATVIPLLLFAVTTGFLSGWRLLPAVRVAAVRLWRGWLLYLGLLAAYSAVFLTALSAAASGPVAPAAQAVSVFARSKCSRLCCLAFLAGLGTGITRRTTSAHLRIRRQAWPGSPSWSSSVWSRPASWSAVGSWRAWLILVVWLVLADTAPVLIGRLNSPAYAGLHGLQTRYVADVPAVLSIVVALVFWSVADPRPDSDGTSRRRREFFTGRWRMIAIAITTVFVMS